MYTCTQVHRSPARFRRDQESRRFNHRIAFCKRTYSILHPKCRSTCYLETFAGGCWPAKKVVRSPRYSVIGNDIPRHGLRHTEVSSRSKRSAKVFTIYRRATWRHDVRASSCSSVWSYPPIIIGNCRQEYWWWKYNFLGI